jgi:hypothetical protein
MTQITGTNARFLTKETILSQVFKIMEPDLTFLPMLPKMSAEGSRSITYKSDETNMSSDPGKMKSRIHTVSAKFPEVKIARMTRASALLNEEGISVRIDRDAMNQVQGIDEIARAYSAMGFWAAEYLNTYIAETLVAGATTPTWTPHAVWSADDATPVEDLRLLKYQMRREGYPYKMTNVYVAQDNYAELEGYLTSADISESKQTKMFGTPTGDLSCYIPIAGATVTGMVSGMSEGSVLALDNRNPAGTIFYNNDPSFSSPSVSYNVTNPVSGTVETRTVPNFGLNTFQYVEDESHDTVIQMWFDQTCVIKEPYAALYDTGI